MDATKFLSSGKYLVLPSKHQPKVYLSFEENRFLKNAFKLYNPFSNKAKIFKLSIALATKYLYTLSSFFLPILKIEQSPFSKYLNSTLNKHIVISLYISTANDKFVLQLQDVQSNIYGYLKYPISEIGKQRILNEKYAIKILSDCNVIPKLLYDGRYEDNPFIILKDMEGSIKQMPNKTYKKVLNLFYKEKEYLLFEHPRVKDLQSKLKILDLTKYNELLSKAILKSNKKYKEVYEHGDFAPWNIIQMSDKIIPIDFEYFVENGLEYLDEIKYHFQINHLLLKKNGFKLINAIASKVNILEFIIIFQIFLIKEIINKHESSKSYDFENLLLKKITSEKA